MRILLFAVLIVFLLPVTASADGMAFEPSPESVSYSALVREERQVAVIAYEDGKETLFLSVDMLPESDSFVWLFPIPAKPDVTDLDVVKTFPKIGGKNVIVEAKRSAEKLAEYSFGSQIYPLIFLLEFRRAAWESSPKATQRAYGPDVLDLEQVVVHKSVTKYGVTTELLTTESKAPLLAYLAEKGLSLPGEAGMILDEYIGGDFSFVTVWREDVAAGEANLPAGRRGKITSNVTISFPTKKIFFPLKPTSIYGKRIIPIEFTIQGYVDPDLPKELREFQSAGYFYSMEPTLLHIEGSDKLRNVQFNRVTWLKIEAESNLLKSDLYMNPAPMLSVVFAEGLFRFSILYFIVLFAITSFVSGEVAGLVVFHRNRSAKDALQHGALGFVNFLTLLGVLIAAGVYTQRNNYGMKHTFAYAGVFTVVFMILNAIIWYSIIRAYSIY